MKNTILYIVLLLSLSSCEKFLAEKAAASFTADFVYNTPDGLEAGVVGLYNIQRSFWENMANNGSNPIVIDAKDDLTLPRGGEIANYGRMIQGTTPENSYVHSDYWKLYYRIMDRANAIIESAEKLQGMSQERKNKVLGEAKFFRANSVFTLFRLFNNIYITTEPTRPDNVAKVITNKSSEADIYALVIADLNDAIEKLDYRTTEPGRITQGMARHLRAEVALWQKDWKEAKLQAEAVINSGAHSLLSSTGLVFKGDLNHSETLWALQFKVLVNGGPNKINFNLMPNYAELMPGSKYTVEQGGRGFGWLTMNNYLRDLLNEDPNDTRIKGSYYIQDYVYNDPATLPAGKVIGEKIVHDTWKEFAPLAADRNAFFIRLNAGCKKYFPDDGNPTVDTQTKNIMMARLAETYLFAAEANLMLGNTSEALAQLNAVRKRAGVKERTSVSMQDILDEQARELAFEGRRWYMLKRTGKLYEYIVDHAGYGKRGDLSAENSPGHANTPEDPFPFRSEARTRMRPHMVNWAIPLAEMNLLGKSYPQNEGY
jgi:hypothetical protein